MATLVGGAFLYATVQTLVEKLASKELRDYIRNRKFNESLLGELETTLLALQVVLDDAEEKQIVKPAVKQWLERLKDAIFDAEDLLDQISTDSLRCKVENTEAENITAQVCNFLSSTSENSYRDINSQMKDMCQRLQLFAQQINILRLHKIKVSRRTPSSPMVNQSVMVGREDDQEKLTNMLLSNNTNNIGVVTILGMGGVGKTTLAQLLYNNQKVQQHFDLRAWACVSEDFDILRVTKTLLESVTSKAFGTDNLALVRDELKQNLRGKRFLFVMDDLWNDKYNDWDELLTPLIDGKAGCKVIITTRQEKVAEVTRTFPIHKLEPLSVEDCWSLLSKHAFGSEDCHGSKYQHLEAIGKKIAKKCGGLPIAAKTLGGLLRSKVDANEWTTILNSNVWDLPNDDILPALRLSYQYLPSHLKRCFSYCSIFPKDYSLDKKQLVLLWMAEGFLEHSEGEKAAEEVGDDYFTELLSRSLIQQDSADANGEKFVMHDLINDLATIVSGKSCCSLECGNISEDVRHLSYKQEKYDIAKKFSYKFKCLRTFLPLGPWLLSYNFLSRKVVDDLLPTLGMLRVLSLSGYRNITVLPNSVDSMVQLRYLDLSKTGIKCLPDTTRKLYNLQTLILLGCHDLTELPLHIGKLVSLRHLDISGTNIRELPMQIAGLENLRTLTVFVVGKQGAGLSVRELRKFPHLQGELSILKLQNVIDPMDAFDANLKNKQIEELVLDWSKQTEDTQKEKAVIDELQPSANLKKLTIESYGGTSFPSWLGASSFSNMVSLHILNCEYCIKLPPLGQLPCLKDLTVRAMTFLETIGPEFYGMAVGGSISSFQPFPSLEYLKFEKMPNWKEWLPFESGELPFPRLETLILDGCHELRGHLPSHLSSIEKFEISNCDHLLATPPTLHWLSSIKQICIKQRVPELSTERTQWSLLGSDTPCLLQNVEMKHCASLPKMIQSSTCLVRLVLRDCPFLTTFPEDGLPTSLQTLRIDGCKNLAFLPTETWRSYTSLRDLTIIYNSCDELTAFPLDGFPALESLKIWGCNSLESIYISESSSLCQSTLQRLTVTNCEALRSLPQRMDTLTHLSLRTLPELEFPPSFTLPPKLRSFNIMDSPRLRAQGITEWGLQRLTALSHLSVKGDDIVNAMLEERLLPISLVHLSICNLSHTTSLEGNGLRHLSSLETLRFWNCPMLESLPEDRLPSSLRTLRFWNCPMLESLPEDWLPSSLKILSIWGCPLLEERYGNQRREHWSKITHIPVLEINYKVTI